MARRSRDTGWLHWSRKRNYSKATRVNWAVNNCFYSPIEQMRGSVVPLNGVIHSLVFLNNVFVLWSLRQWNMNAKNRTECLVRERTTLCVYIFRAMSKNILQIALLFNYRITVTALCPTMHSCPHLKSMLHTIVDKSNLACFNFGFRFF